MQREEALSPESRKISAHARIQARLARKAASLWRSVVTPWFVFRRIAERAIVGAKQGDAE
jgi:hypothetical protein